MTLVISLVIFSISIYFYILTQHKLNQITKQKFFNDEKKEMNSLINEFNLTATRNIELIEDSITRVKEVIERANRKIQTLEDKIQRAQNPIIVEKLVQTTNTDKKDALSPKTPKPKPTKLKKPNDKPKEPKKEPISNLPINPTQKETENPRVKTRSEILNELIEKELPKKDIIAQGFMENEINMALFMRGQRE